MHHIIYLSRPTAALSNEELMHLLDAARRTNQALGITGILFYGEGQIAQLLEGEQQAVEQVYAKICADPRHADVIKLADKDIPARAFDSWAMAYEPVTGQAFKAVSGYLNPHQAQVPPAQLTAADALLYDLIRNTITPQT
ncbi:BLUF domain-containing protein [Hymenobacter pini]|uniref:BLUF domain-containing protein n=1 Tax=Hymenobacter pini TaxID=2880879 RepID=UPI001CF5AAE4|nr:BLUF domain-containing protein [Hymenobacter pini]MCA8830327.1 BLUF domain-containing protein [Hymenobacter pini]